MIMKHSVAEAYSVLGLEEDSSLDIVKSTYKQIALRTHPDKNPDNPDATAQFQRVSEAYNVLVKYLDKSSRPGPRGPPNNPSFGFEAFSDDDDAYSDDGEYYSDSGDEYENLGFYKFVFEQMMKDQANRYMRSRYSARSPGFRYEPQSAPESSEAYHARIKRTHEEQVAAQERRAQEAVARKAKAEKDRERERRQAEERQKAKIENKKAQLETQRRKAENAVRAQQQRTQALRSAIFAAARAGDAEKVKKGIWEDNVDAAGGEIKKGSENFVVTSSKDPKETLLHIAAKCGDAELVEWLDSHSAEADERNSQGLTAAHIALKHGHANVIRFFFQTYPPNESESESIYATPSPTTLLTLSLDSYEPEAVWMVLDNRLATSEEIEASFIRIISQEGVVSGKNHDHKAVAKDYERTNDIKQLLLRYGNFTAPIPRAQKVEPTYSESSRVEQKQSKQKQPKNPNHPRAPEPFPSQIPDSNDIPPKSSSIPGGRGRGRGRGRGPSRGAPLHSNP